MDANRQFLYLNRGGLWHGLQWYGLSLDCDGTLHLDTLPLWMGEPRPDLADLPAARGVAGIVVAADDTVFFTDPDGERLLSINPCGDVHQTSVAVCMGGHGDQPAQFNQPRGLSILPARHALIVADSGNHRLQLFDLQTQQLIDVWGAQGADPGHFDTPISVASDGQSYTYVLDYGNCRVQKFDVQGDVITAFWDTMQSALNEHQVSLIQPGAIAVDDSDGSVFILDACAQSIFVFDSSGGWREPICDERLVNAMGLAVDNNACAPCVLYVGDNVQRRVMKFKRDGTFVGEAIGFDGPVAALGLDHRGHLLVHVGNSATPARLATESGYVKRGQVWGGPFTTPSSRLEQFHWLRATLDLPAEAHVQLFIFRDNATPTSKPVTALQLPWSDLSRVVDAITGQRECDSACMDKWMRMPLDTSETLFAGAPNECIWIAIDLSGDGLNSPRLMQMRLDFDHPTYMRHLPPIYLERAESRRFLSRFLTLFEGTFDKIEGQINDLALLFDPAAAPQWSLRWLGSWLGLTVEEDWTEIQQRQRIAEAFASYARRGLQAGLKAAVLESLGVVIQIDEPILNASWWLLPESNTQPDIMSSAGSVLSFNTMLAPMEAQPAVLGTTAVLDRSKVMSGDDAGVTIFEDLVHRFTVSLYRGKYYSEGVVAQVRKFIEREKPAHTAFDLCVIEPRTMIGYQSRVGIDTIVAETGQGIYQNDPANFFLSGERSRIGENTRIGME